MNITPPCENITVYTKSNCIYCTKVKELLPDAQIVLADVYLKKNRQNFLNYIASISGKKPNTFPMVFWHKRFIGGYDDTKQYVDELNTFSLNSDF
jgi:glutaredoxin